MNDVTRPKRFSIWGDSGLHQYQTAILHSDDPIMHLQAER